MYYATVVRLHNVHVVALVIWTVVRPNRRVVGQDPCQRHATLASAELVDFRVESTSILLGVPIGEHPQFSTGGVVLAS